MSKNNYIVLNIDNTRNAAFSLGNREHEVARIINDAAAKVKSSSSLQEIDFPLMDYNGNSVGRIQYSTVVPSGDLEEGSIRLTLDTYDGACFNSVITPEGAGGILSKVASKALNGEHAFATKDANGNRVGNFEWREEKSLASDNVVDMNTALSERRVYIVDDGYSCIADGEYRFVVTTSDFEPGYHQEEGAAWLVNAKGEIASGYEDTKVVRELDFRSMNSDEMDDLRAVIDGHKSFEDYERQFDEEDDLDLS